jgi:hypothetical protein
MAATVLRLGVVVAASSGADVGVSETARFPRPFGAADVAVSEAARFPRPFGAAGSGGAAVLDSDPGLLRRFPWLLDDEGGGGGPIEPAVPAVGVLCSLEDPEA